MQSQSGIEQSNPLRGGQQVFAYDDVGNIISLQNQNNNTTTLTYDGLGRLTGRTDPLGETTGYTYDKRGNVIRIALPIGRNVTYAYDALAHVTQVSHGGDNIRMTYDANGNMLTVVDGDSSVSFAYDGDDRKVTERTLAGGSQPEVALTSVYSAAGRRTSLSSSTGGSNVYEYDATGRLTSVTPFGGAAITLGYDGSGRIAQVQYPNGVTSSYTSGPEGRYEGILHAGGTTLASFAYSHDSNGDIASITELSKTRQFGYDDLQQVTSAGSAGAESYAYDAAGNRSSTHLSTSTRRSQSPDCRW